MCALAGPFSAAPGPGPSVGVAPSPPPTRPSVSPCRTAVLIPDVPLLLFPRTLVTSSSSSLRLALSPFPISRPLCFISPFAFTMGKGH